MERLEKGGDLNDVAHVKEMAYTYVTTCARECVCVCVVRRGLKKDLHTQVCNHKRFFGYDAAEKCYRYGGKEGGLKVR